MVKVGRKPELIVIAADQTGLAKPLLPRNSFITNGPKISYLTNNENYQHIRRIDSRSCAPSQGEVNGSTSWCPIGRISPIRPIPPNAKAPFSIFFAKYMRHLRHISIIISVRYNPTDRKNRPFGLRFLCRNSQY